MTNLAEQAKDLQQLAYWLMRDAQTYANHPHPLNMQEMQRRMTAIERTVKEARAELTRVTLEVSA
jgi:hypothetical protein